MWTSLGVGSLLARHIIKDRWEAETQARNTSRGSGPVGEHFPSRACHAFCSLLPREFLVIIQNLPKSNNIYSALLSLILQAKLVAFLSSLP